MSATVEIVNTGNVRLSGHVEVTVSGPFGMLARSVRGASVDDLLPGQSLRDDLVVDGVWPSGRLEVEVRFVTTGSVGQELTTDDVDGPVATATVWAIPWLALLFVIAAVVVAVVVLRRRRKREPPVR